MANSKLQVFENQSFARIRCIISGPLMNRSSTVRITTRQVMTDDAATGKYSTLINEIL